MRNKNLWKKVLAGTVSAAMVLSLTTVPNVLMGTVEAKAEGIVIEEESVSDAGDIAIEDEVVGISEDEVSPIGETEETVATIEYGDTTKVFSTLKEAVDEAPTGTPAKITLNCNYEYNEALEINNGKEITLDLGGHTLTGPSLTIGEAKVTLTNGTFDYDYAIYVVASETDNTYNHLTVMENATVKGTYPIILWQAAYGASNFGSIIDIYGEIQGVAGAGVFVMGNILTDLTTAKHPCEVNVHETAKITCNSSNAGLGIALNGSAKLSVAPGAEIHGYDSAIEVRAGQLTIDGGTFIADAVPTEVSSNGSGTTTSGAAIAVAQHTTKLPIKVTINDGMFKGFSAFYESNPQDNDLSSISKIELAIKGGNFETINDGTKAIYSTYSKNFISGGTFSDLSGLSYIKDGASYNLSRDAVLSSQLTISNDNVTLDGAGHTISVANGVNTWDVDNSGKYMLLVSDSSNTSIRNVILDGAMTSGLVNGGIQFYKADNGKISNVTLNNFKNLGLIVNASTVSATGKLSQSNIGWKGINVGYGSGIEGPRDSKFDCSEANVSGVEMIYTDEKSDLANVTAAGGDINNFEIRVPSYGWIKSQAADKALFYIPYEEPIYNNPVTPEPTPTPEETPIPEPTPTPSVPDGTVTNPDGSTTTTTIETNPDGSTTTTVVDKDAEGNKTGTTVTTEKTEGNTTTKTETTTTADGKEIKKESILVENEDGSSKEEATITDSNGAVTKLTTTTETDGSSTEVKETTETNEAGKDVEVTTTTEKDTKGEVTSVKEQSVISAAAAEGTSVTSVTVTVLKDGKGNVQYSRATVQQPVDGDTTKIILDSSVMKQIVDASGTPNVTITFVVRKAEETVGTSGLLEESTGVPDDAMYTLKVASKNLVPGNVLYVYKENPVTKERTMVNNLKYIVKEDGSVDFKTHQHADFVLVNEATAANLNKAIKKTVTPAKTSTTVKVGKTTKMAMNPELNMANVRKITYSSSKSSVVKVSSKGVITGKKAGTAYIYAKVTLRNYDVKTVKMKVTVQK